MKNVRTHIINLLRCGIDRWHAQKWGYVKGYWRIAGSPILSRAIDTDKLRNAGYPMMLDYYRKYIVNKELPYAGPYIRCVRGQKMK